MLLAVTVSTLVPDTGSGENDAATPMGSPDALRVTLPLNPFISFTVIVAVLDVPGETTMEVAETLTVKFADVTVNRIVVEDVNPPEVPVIVIA